MIASIELAHHLSITVDFRFTALAMETTTPMPTAGVTWLKCVSETAERHESRAIGRVPQ
jgi:hypothetical protein